MGEGVAFSSKIENSTTIKFKICEECFVNLQNHFAGKNGLKFDMKYQNEESEHHLHGMDISQMILEDEISENQTEKEGIISGEDGVKESH